MARTTKSTERRSNPAIVPGLIALVLIGGAIVVALVSRKPKEASASAPEKKKPFADMPPEVLPPPKQHKPGSNLPAAPEGLSSEPLWVEAKVLAAEGRVFYDAAVKARIANDASGARENGIAARAKYDKAVELTAEWEESVLAKYNEYDAQVRAIKDERTDWFNKLKWLQKSTGH